MSETLGNLRAAWWRFRGGMMFGHGVYCRTEGKYRIYHRSPGGGWWCPKCWWHEVRGAIYWFRTWQRNARLRA